MKTFISLLLVNIFVFTFTSCSTVKKIEALKPIATENSPLIYKNKVSFIAMPIEIALLDIQSQINKNLKGLIYEDDDFESDNTKIPKKIIKYSFFSLRYKMIVHWIVFK